MAQGVQAAFIPTGLSSVLGMRCAAERWHPLTRPGQHALSAWRRVAGRTRTLLVVAVAMGIGAIYAVVSIVFDRSDEATSAVALPVLLVGLIFATALATRRLRS